jgi:hypothetical protein
MATGELRVTVAVEAADPAGALARAEELVGAAFATAGIGVRADARAAADVMWRHVDVEPVLVA